MKKRVVLTAVAIILAIFIWKGFVFFTPEKTVSFDISDHTEAIESYHYYDPEYRYLGAIDGEDSARELAKQLFEEKYDKTVRKINLKYDAEADVWYARGYFWEDIRRIKYGLKRLNYGSHAIIRASDGEVLTLWHDRD